MYDKSDGHHYGYHYSLNVRSLVHGIRMPLLVRSMCVHENSVYIHVKYILNCGDLKFAMAAKASLGDMHSLTYIAQSYTAAHV